MIIKEISTQSFDERYPETNNRPYLFRNSENYPPQEWQKIIECLKRNAAAGLLRYEIIEK